MGFSFVFSSRNKCFLGLVCFVCFSSKHKTSGILVFLSFLAFVIACVREYARELDTDNSRNSSQTLGSRLPQRGWYRNVKSWDSAEFTVLFFVLLRGAGWFFSF